MPQTKNCGNSRCQIFSCSLTTGSRVVENLRYRLKVDAHEFELRISIAPSTTESTVPGSNLTKKKLKKNTKLVPCSRLSCTARSQIVFLKFVRSTGGRVQAERSCKSTSKTGGAEAKLPDTRYVGEMVSDGSLEPKMASSSRQTFGENMDEVSRVHEMTRPSRAKADGVVNRQAAR